MSHPSYGTGDADDRRPEPYGAPSAPLPASDLPPRPATPGARVGRAYGVAVRQESQYSGNSTNLLITVLEFRLAEPGNPRPLDVLLRGRSLSGTVRDGDWVELAGPPDATNRWNVDRVQNLTTGSTVVVVGGRRSKAATVVVLVVVVLMLMFFAVVAIGVLSSFGSM